jgi:putative flippase GtrA
MQSDASMINISPRLQPSAQLTTQILKFTFVGLFTVFLDYATMVLLVEVFRWNYLGASTVGFALGSSVNYFLSIRFVFVTGKYSNQITEMILFMVITIVGLALNYFLMWLFTEWFKFVYLYSKLFSIVFVSSSNFVMKKVIVFKG